MSKAVSRGFLYKLKTSIAKGDIMMLFMRGLAVVGVVESVALGLFKGVAAGVVVLVGGVGSNLSLLGECIYWIEPIIDMLLKAEESMTAILEALHESISGEATLNTLLVVGLLYARDQDWVV